MGAVLEHWFWSSSKSDVCGALRRPLHLTKHLYSLLMLCPPLWLPFFAQDFKDAQFEVLQTKLMNRKSDMSTIGTTIKKTDREWSTRLSYIDDVSKRSSGWCRLDLLLLGWACKCILAFAWIIFLRWSVGWWAELHHIVNSSSTGWITQLLAPSVTCYALHCSGKGKSAIK